MPSKSRLTLIVAAIALSVVAVSFYAVADGCKSGCSTAPAACAGQQSGCGGGCAAKLSGGRSTLLTRPYFDGVVRLRVGACAGGSSIMLGVFKQANRLDPNVSVSAQLITPGGNVPVALKQMKPGIFCASADLACATGVGVTVSGPAFSNYLVFDLPAKASACGAMPGGGCQTTGEGKCAGMTAGVCKPAAAKTAACKCAVCKCSPCQCK